MEAKFTEQESLAVISQMIEQARNNLQKGSGNGMIFAGWMVAIIAILNALLMLLFHKKGINTDYSMLVWISIIPGTYINYLIQKKDNRKSMVKTHIDSIVSAIWSGFAYSVIILLAVFFGIGLGKKFYHVFSLITPVMLIMLGSAGFVMAKACRFSPIGAVVMWLGALVCIGAMWLKYPYPIIIMTHFFIYAICMIFGMVLQGYQLNKLANKNV